MKMSRSEKTLIIILLTLLVVGGYYKFIHVKENIKIQALKVEEKKYDDELQDIKLSISTSTKREKDVKILNSEIQEKTSSIYPAIQQGRLIIELDALLKKSNVEGAFTFTAIKAADTQNKTTTSGTTSTSDDTSKPLQTIVDQYNTMLISGTDDGDKTTVSNYKKEIKGSTEYTQASLSFKGSYDNIIGLIKNIENNSKKIILSNLALNGSSTGELSGTANLEFYSVPKFAGMDVDYFKWDYNNTYGKKNPFVSLGTKNNTVSTTIEDASKPKEDIKDFAMSVRSVNSDLPAIMLGNYNDTQRKSYVYADENSAAAVEMVFVEAGGKFHYKYKIGSSSYPQQYSGNGVEFTPSSKDISAVIFSNKRLSDTDNVGVNISVINKTSRVVNIYVSNDDGVKPRVSVKGEGSAVNIKNQ
ncbi:MAG: hypothetical protein ACREVX_14985 [Clostridium sp.]|uniref:hypothetical protein n=1 Tax=Clostridium sp. TaxID=1506 RepID=UPI003D6D3DF7